MTANLERTPTHEPRVELLYYFCRLQLPAVLLSVEQCESHLRRTFQIFQKKNASDIAWEAYLDNLYPLDWFTASACLEGIERAWEQLFASKAGRSDCLLMDALRARAARLYPRDDERQDSAVTEFWGHLCVSDSPGSVPVLARYDGQRPLVPWLIRVFQNWHISQLRKHPLAQALPDDDLSLPMPDAAPVDSRWREVFAQATHDWLSELDDNDVLLLGLRVRCRMSQREVAQLLSVHEGTISRNTDRISGACQSLLKDRLEEAGWTGDDLAELIRTEMHHLLLDDPRLSADSLARVLAKKGKLLPASA